MRQFSIQIQITIKKKTIENIKLKVEKKAVKTAKTAKKRTLDCFRVATIVQLRASH